MRFGGFPLEARRRRRHLGRVMFGVFLDVTPRKQAEETREMLAAEMSHRVKNLFAIAAALTAIAARSAATTTEMARDLTQRLTALGRRALYLSCIDHKDHLVIVWTERGGPAVAGPPGRRFGSRLVFQSPAGQLGGSIAYDWLIAGVVITLRMSKARLTT